MLFKFDSKMYLGNYLGSVETVPQEIKRNFALMRELDDKVEDLMIVVEERQSVYLENVKKDPKEVQNEGIKETIEEHYKTCHSYCDEKTSLAEQSYEILDTHIKRLEEELSKFEKELESKGISTSAQTQVPRSLRFSIILFYFTDLPFFRSSKIKGKRKREITMCSQFLLYQKNWQVEKGKRRNFRKLPLLIFPNIQHPSLHRQTIQQTPLFTFPPKVPTSPSTVFAGKFLLEKWWVVITKTFVLFILSSHFLYFPISKLHSADWSGFTLAVLV